MSAPFTPLLDDFNRAALGANWQQAVSAYSPPTITGNKLDWPQFPSCCRTETFLQAQEAVITPTWTATAPAVAFLLRWANLNTGSESGYVMSFDPSLGNCDLNRWTAGPGTAQSLGFKGNGTLQTGTGTRYWGIVQEDQFSIYSSIDAGANWVFGASWADSDVAARLIRSGQIGLYSGNNPGTAAQLDDFGGGTIPSSVAWYVG